MGEKGRAARVPQPSPRPFFIGTAFFPACATPIASAFTESARMCFTMMLEETLISVWRQALAEKREAVDLGGKEYPVRRTAKRGLCQIDFSFEGHGLRGLEQNPQRESRWAQLARAGKRVMQFLEGGRYIAVVVEGKVTLYGKRK
jgi:hypothetical protein